MEGVVYAEVEGVAVEDSGTYIRFLAPYARARRGSSIRFDGGFLFCIFGACGGTIVTVHHGELFFYDFITSISLLPVHIS